MGQIVDDWEYFVTHDLMGCHSALDSRQSRFSGILPTITRSKTASNAESRPPIILDSRFHGNDKRGRNDP